MSSKKAKSATGNILPMRDLDDENPEITPYAYVACFALILEEKNQHNKFVTFLNFFVSSSRKEKAKSAMPSFAEFSAQLIASTSSTKLMYEII